MKRVIAFLTALALVTSNQALAGLGTHVSMYVGGTVKTIPLKTEAVLNVDGEKFLSFKWKDGDWQLPYDKITSLAYGQHAGRRVGATVALGVTTLGLGALPVLFSKKRRHYLTIEYADEQGQAQAAIFEIGKDAIRTTLKVIEVRSGKKLEYEDEEARKAGTK